MLLLQQDAAECVAIWLVLRLLARSWSARYELTSNLAAAAGQSFAFLKGASDDDGEQKALPSKERKAGSK